MNSVVEYQHVAIRQQGWRMLSGDHRRTELPKDFPSFAGDASYRGRRSKAGQDISVRQLLETVAVGPKCPRCLDLCDAVRHGV